MVTVKGKVLEVGMLAAGRGFRMEVEGEDVTITGLTMEECQAIAPFFDQVVEISIKPTKQ